MKPNPVTSHAATSSPALGRSSAPATADAATSHRTDGSSQAEESARAADLRPAATGKTVGAAKNSIPVRLVTDRPSFEQEWKEALTSAGLIPTATSPGALPGQLSALTGDSASSPPASPGTARGAVVIIDAGSKMYDEDELLSHVGLARALGATVAVSVPTDMDVRAIDDMLDDLCGGRVARRAEDRARVIASLARRADPTLPKRFEYLTISPRADQGGELLAIFSDGSAALVDRPVSNDDDASSAVGQIALEKDATVAVLALDNGRECRVTAEVIARKALLKKTSNGKTNGGIDGVKLGQRIRQLRLAAGLTQAELARRTGIHRPNIARVEAGRHTPSLETLARLANAIGVPTTRVLDD